MRSHEGRASTQSYFLSVDALGKYDADLRCHGDDVNGSSREVSTLRDRDPGYWAFP